MTHKELVKLLRKPGRVMLPVMLPNDVIHIECVKADMLNWSKQHGPDESCGWHITNQGKEWVTLDTSEE